MAWCGSSNFVDLRELCIVPGKAAWMAYLVYPRFHSKYAVGFAAMKALAGAKCCSQFFSLLQDVYCLDADGSLLDAGLLAAVAALAHCMCTI